MIRRPPRSTLFPTRRSSDLKRHAVSGQRAEARRRLRPLVGTRFQDLFHSPPGVLFTFPSRYWCTIGRSEEHTSELQSRLHLVCRLLLEKKKQKISPRLSTMC